MLKTLIKNYEMKVFIIFRKKCIIKIRNIYEWFKKNMSILLP